MRWLLIVIGVCFALAVLRAAIVVLFILVALSVLWGVFFRPAETFGFIALLLFSAVLQTHTIAVLVLIGFLGLVVIASRPVEREDRKPSSTFLLPDRSNESRPPGEG